jgi:accessory colonization factor AcfC
MSAPKKPLKPDDFPINADGTKIKKQDGTTIANTEEATVAEDVADRLNADEAQREEDKWSA